MDDRSLAGRDGRGSRPPLARANGGIDDYRRALSEQRQGLLNRKVSPFEIDGYHLVEALLCHLFEQQELAVTCIYEDAVQVPELPLDRGEHRVEVTEIADVRANGQTSSCNNATTCRMPQSGIMVQLLLEGARHATQIIQRRPVPRGTFARFHR